MKVASRLLVVGRDKTGLALAARAARIPDVTIYADASGDYRRVLRLIRTGRLPVTWLARMMWAELRRPTPAHREIPELQTNRELLSLVANGVRTIFLFRAGLIVNREVLASGAAIFNVHCASLQGYGGIGAIPRALNDRAFDQVATLHRVTTRIDEGEVIATQPYRLDPRRSFRANEDVAYDAGRTLILRHLTDQGDRVVDDGPARPA
jgi:hypothetical protein